MDPYVHFLPQCGVQYLSVLKLVWFPPIDGVISLVMRKKRVYLSMRSCVLWRKGAFQREFMAELYFIDWEITEYIKRNISLQSQNSLA